MADSIKFLVADDDKIVVKLLGHILKGAFECDVENALSGAEAWELLEGGYIPNVCLFDLDMPGLDGIELVTRMRECPEYDNVPILFITSKQGLDEKATAAALDVFAYLEKPFKPRFVESLIREAIAHYGGSFAPAGFEDREGILLRERMDSKQYFKLLYCFVEMLGMRLDLIERNLYASRSRLADILCPLRKFGKQLGATRFLSHFDRVEKASEVEESGERDLKRSNFRRLRMDFYYLKDEIEAQFNVVIDVRTGHEIRTEPYVSDSMGEGIRLKAELEPGRAAYGLSEQSLLVSAVRGDSQLMSLRVSVDGEEIVMKQVDGQAIVCRDCTRGVAE